MLFKYRFENWIYVCNIFEKNFLNFIIKKKNSKKSSRAFNLLAEKSIVWRVRNVCALC